MDITLLHPRDQIVMIMERIYGYGLTTTSGGNLSIRDDDGSIWISPGGVDKGSLRAEDIVCVQGETVIESIHAPSLELPFHRAIYAARPDVRAILHAHPAALVSFSITCRTPDTRIIPNAWHTCGEVGLAPYGIPGSEELASNVAETFAQGYNTIIMENHGTVVVGGDLFEAFRRFETLDFCARLIARANGVGKAYPLNQRQLGFLQAQGEGADPEPAPGRAPLTFQPAVHSSRERQLRKDMVRLIHRAYDQLLFTSTEGTFSARVEHRKGGETNAGDDEVRFLITPYGVDRKYMEVSDLVLISGDKQEAGKTPSRSAELHREIYRHHPHIQSVMIAHPPNITAFAVAHKKFDTTLIPESYVFLREIPLLSFGAQYHEYENVVGMLSREVVMILIENDCIISTGESLLQSFDRLEIAEFTAQAVLMARDIGPLAPISGDQIAELKRRFM